MSISKNDPVLLAYRAAKDPAVKRKLSGKLVRENQNLVHKLVQKFGRWAPPTVEMDDMVQAGYLAFLYTIDHIDTSMTFSTYYAYRVWYEISKLLEKHGVVYQPRNRSIPYKVLRKMEQIETNLGRPATAEELGVTADQLEKWLQPVVTSSIDVEVGDGASLHDVIPDTANTPEQDLAEKELKEGLSMGLMELPILERTAIEICFIRERTAKEAAAEMKLPVQHVHELLEHGLKLLREQIEDE